LMESRVVMVVATAFVVPSMTALIVSLPAVPAMVSIPVVSVLVTSWHKPLIYIKHCDNARLWLLRPTANLRPNWYSVRSESHARFFRPTTDLYALSFHLPQKSAAWQSESLVQ
jgi:hypothetical protein